MCQQQPDVELSEFCAFADEMGHPDDPNRRVFGFGGFVAKSKNWESFCNQWRAVRASETVPFHMADFAQRRGFFFGWAEGRRRALLNDLVTVIKQNDLIPIFTVILLSDYRSLRKTTKKKIGDIYWFVLSHFFSQVAFSVLSAQPCSLFAPQPRVSIVFAKSEFSGRANKSWWQTKSSGMGPLSAVLSSLFIELVFVETPNTTLELQAADLWAYEVGRHFEFVLPNEKESRWAFQQLSSLPAVEGVAKPSFEVLSKDTMSGNSVVFGNLMAIE